MIYTHPVRELEQEAMMYTHAVYDLVLILSYVLLIQIVSVVHMIVLWSYLHVCKLLIYLKSEQMGVRDTPQKNWTEFNGYT